MHSTCELRCQGKLHRSCRSSSVWLLGCYSVLIVTIGSVTRAAFLATAAVSHTICSIAQDSNSNGLATSTRQGVPTW